MQRSNRLIILGLIVIILVMGWFLIEKPKNKKTQSEVLITKEKLADKSPKEIIQRLKAGNQRFMDEDLKEADFSSLVSATMNAQHPGALVLSCIDSRVPPEIIFDQAIGNIFVSRVAAQVVSPDIIAGMEYATKVTGSKVIVVLGHTRCGAVNAACKQVKMGNITSLLAKIQPAVEQTSKQQPNESCQNHHYVDEIAENNVKNIVAEIPKMSAILQELVDRGELEIVGAMYDTSNGKVDFLL